MRSKILIALMVLSVFSPLISPSSPVEGFTFRSDLYDMQWYTPFVNVGEKLTWTCEMGWNGAYNAYMYKVPYQPFDMFIMRIDTAPPIMSTGLAAWYDTQSYYTYFNQNDSWEYTNYNYEYPMVFPISATNGTLPFSAQNIITDMMTTNGFIVDPWDSEYAFVNSYWELWGPYNVTIREKMKFDISQGVMKEYRMEYNDHSGGQYIGYYSFNLNSMAMAGPITWSPIVEELANTDIPYRLDSYFNSGIYPSTMFMDGNWFSAEEFTLNYPDPPADAGDLDDWFANSTMMLDGAFRVRGPEGPMVLPMTWNITENVLTFYVERMQAENPGATWDGSVLTFDKEREHYWNENEVNFTYHYEMKWNTQVNMMENFAMKIWETDGGWNVCEIRLELTLLPMHGLLTWSPYVTPNNEFYYQFLISYRDTSMFGGGAREEEPQPNPGDTFIMRLPTATAPTDLMYIKDYIMSVEYELRTWEGTYPSQGPEGFPLFLPLICDGDDGVQYFYDMMSANPQEGQTYAMSGDTMIITRDWVEHQWNGIEEVEYAIHQIEELTWNAQNFVAHYYSTTTVNGTLISEMAVSMNSPMLVGNVTWDAAIQQNYDYSWEILESAYDPEYMTAGDDFPETGDTFTLRTSGMIPPTNALDLNEFYDGITFELNGEDTDGPGYPLILPLSVNGVDGLTIYYNHLSASFAHFTGASVELVGTTITIEVTQIWGSESGPFDVVVTTVIGYDARYICTSYEETYVGDGHEIMHILVGYAGEEPTGGDTSTFLPGFELPIGLFALFSIGLAAVAFRKR